MSFIFIEKIRKGNSAHKFYSNMAFLHFDIAHFIRHTEIISVSVTLLLGWFICFQAKLNSRQKNKRGHKAVSIVKHNPLSVIYEKL